ncbi:hypothetical protein ACWERW_20020 [Streptomyces sp. NPDC004012]
MPERHEAARAVFRGVRRGHGDNRDAGFRGKVPHALDDGAADLLGQAGVEAAAHAFGFHRSQVLDVDGRRTRTDRLVDGPPCRRDCKGVVEARPARAHTLELLHQAGMPRRQGFVGSFPKARPPSGEALAVIGLRVEVLGQPPQSVLLCQHTRGPELRARTQSVNSSITAETYGAGRQQRVQAPVDAERDHMPATCGLQTA